jgi:hypothetical protein
MARYELSIKASYVSNWGLYPSIREFVQNARDAEIQFGAPMTVKFSTSPALERFDWLVSFLRTRETLFTPWFMRLLTLMVVMVCGATRTQSEA